MLEHSRKTLTFFSFAIFAVLSLPFPSVVSAAPPVVEPLAVSTDTYVAPEPSGEPKDIEALKKLIDQDQALVKKTRLDLKKAEKARKPKLIEPAREAWRRARLKLQLDRESLKKSVHLREKDRSESQKLREELQKTQDMAPPPVEAE